MDRRTFLAGAAGAPAALLPLEANADSGSASDVAAALARFRQSIPGNFEQDYVEHVLIPFFLTSTFEGEPPLLPVINVTLSKENAFPAEFLGLVYKGWKPSPEEGVTVFLQGLEYRGENNLRKRIYMSALTPDLYRLMYRDKVVSFFDQLFDEKMPGSQSSDIIWTITSIFTGISTSVLRAALFPLRSVRSEIASTQYSLT